VTPFGQLFFFNLFILALNERFGKRLLGNVFKSVSIFGLNKAQSK